MAVKLDVLINYLFDNTKLKKGISDLNKQMISAWSPYTRRQILNMGQRGNLREYLDRMKISAKQFNDILANTKSQINVLNTKGYFQPFLESMGILNRKNLKKKEVSWLAKQLSFEQVEELYKEKKLEKQNQINLAKNIEQQRKLDIKRNIQHSKALEENKKRDEALRKKQWMLILGKWGKFGVWGIAAQQAIKYISKAVGFAYSTSMQGLDWQRTISGGASGGSWFGQGLASYQRAGIGANQYQGFKRGIQGYLGQVKLGMGNAAPLMYLGLSALGNPDELERELERSLRRLPKDVSLALAGQMGLDYNMWEAIYSGRLDREKSAYSEEAIQKWSMVADKLNDLLTTLKVFGFNKLADVAYNVTHPSEVIGQMGFFDKMLMKLGMANPLIFGSTALLRFGTLNIVVKNEKGEVIGKGETQPDYSSDIIELGSGVK